MLPLTSLYQQKCQSAEQAVSRIPKRAAISIGMRAATPPALLQALAQRASLGELEQLKVYYMRCGKIAMQTIFQEALLDVIHPYSSMLSLDEVLLMKKGYEQGKNYVHYVPISFSHYPRTIAETVNLDAFLVTVAPMDKNGYFNFGIHGDYAIELARKAKTLIVEVNPQMPCTGGMTLLHLSEIDAIVEHEAVLQEDLPRPISKEDESIGQTIAEMVPNGATIQLGIGSVPNAICAYLKNHQNLGLHTEVLTPGIVELIQAGVINNQQKQLHRYHHVFTFAAGNRAMYDFIHQHPAMACYPVSHVNDPFTIGKMDYFVSVNSFIEIDLLGQVNSEYLQHQFSGAGGQLDFIRGAYQSKGGKAILASHSTTDGGKISKIVPRLQSITTDTRLDVDYVVTEFGCTRLIGKSVAERAHALIELAHPDFRESLYLEAKRLKLF